MANVTCGVPEEVKPRWAVGWRAERGDRSPDVDGAVREEEEGGGGGVWYAAGGEEASTREAEADADV